MGRWQAAARSRAEQARSEEVRNVLRAVRGRRRSVLPSGATQGRPFGQQFASDPHLLRHSIATMLLDSGLVPIDHLQNFLGHLDLSTTQIYAETSLRALGDNYIRALGGTR